MCLLLLASPPQVFTQCIGENKITVTSCNYFAQIDTF